MEKKYNHTQQEELVSKIWEKGGYFKGKIDKNKKPFTILLPPPNANGRLHVGHALMLAIEDTLIRWKKLKGFSTLWVPGTDHAGFETQIVYEKQLAKQGKSRFDFDRETLYNNIFEFVKDQGNQIKSQIKSLGPSLDWSRETFMLDDFVVDTVLNTFEKMVKDGLVYRDSYIVNYCTHHQTTLSDLELEKVEKSTKLYYIKYPLKNKENNKNYVVVATTRPEPIFVDTHLAVNPKDKKNNWLIGKKVLNPLTNKEMSVIGDSFVDPKFGTGVVKLTPAHDKNDFEVALKHKLPVVSAFGVTGKINKSGGELAGLSVNEAREKAVKILNKKGLIKKVDDNYKNSVSVCFKCNTIIEPLVLPNWFLKVGKLKKKALKVVKEGEVNIYPKWQKTKYFRWMEEMRDWPISRQIVWGIRIPAWYDLTKNDNIQISFLHNKKLVSGVAKDLLKKYSVTQINKGLQALNAPVGSKYVVSKKSPGKNFIQETDTFDTWFSSGQWPLTTLKYPNSEEFNYFYPTSVLETGWEILRFWVSRMIMFGIYLTKKPPFKDVYLHGLVRAKDGKKMSKSLGNVVDPLDSVKEYGADALRMGLIMATAGGKDFNFPQDKIIGFRNFANKLWNMARFINLLNERLYEEKGIKPKTFKSIKLVHSEDKKIIKKLKTVAKAVDKDLQNYKFAQAGEKIYHFVWDNLASSYIEHTKTREDKDTALGVLMYAYKQSLIILHPFMPFVTEAIWQNIKSKKDKDLMVQSWPKY